MTASPAAADDGSTGVPAAGTVVRIETTVNGTTHRREVPARATLADFLRNDLRLTGTKVGCEHGVCGACTVLVDDEPACSCLVLAAQVHGHRVRTVESLAAADGLNPLQASLRRHHGLQCGFCTAGILMAATALLERNPRPRRAEVGAALSGNLCRCTGYETILSAILDAGSPDGSEVAS